MESQLTKTIKYIIGIVVITIISLLTIPFFISLDTYKEVIENQVKEHTGRDLKIDGKISLNILPAPQITLTKLTLSSLPQAKAANLLAMESVSGKLSLLPLFKGKIVITSIDLIKPVINLEMLKNGKGNWVFQNSKVAKTEATSTQSKNPKASLPFIINDINIQKGTLKYIDKEKYVYIEDIDLNIAIKDIYNFTSTTSSSANISGGSWSHEKIDLSSLASANGAINFKAKKIKGSNFTFDNLIIKSELNDGVLKIKSLTMGLYDGKLEGSCSISGKTNQPISLKLKLTNAKLQNIVPDGNRIKVIGGIIDFACDIKSEGSSQFDYIKNMHGNINLSGKDGKISGADLHKLIRALDKPTDIGALTSGLSGSIGKGETIFSSLKSDLSIDKGIMNITKCELISGETSAVSEGRINLPGLTLDASTTINSGAKNLPPVTIYFYGPLNNPQHRIDVKAIWQYLAKNALTGVIDKLKQGKIKPKDFLKGIIDSNKAENNDDVENSEAENVDESPGDAASKLLEKGIKGFFK